MKPTLVHIVPCVVFLERETGGVSNIARQISLHAHEAGYSVRIICGDRELGVKQAEAGTQDFGGIRRTVLQQRSHPFLGPVDDLKKEIEALPENCVVHVHTCFSRFCETAMKVLKAKGIPFVFTPHGKLSPWMMSNSAFLKQLWFQCLTKSALRSADSVAASSKDEAAHLEKLGVSVNDVVSNGFELPSGEPPLPAALQGMKYVLYLGYIDPRKQPELVVRAFAQSQARKTHQLLIVGPDDYNHSEKVVEEINTHQLQDQVLMYGPAYGDEKAAILRGASCFCLPSKGEGQPVVLSEAIGAGVPVVYSRACNFSELHDQKLGVMLDHFGTQEWAQAMDLMCDRSGEWHDVSERCRQASQQYQWKEVVSRWLDVYERIFDHPS